MLVHRRSPQACRVRTGAFRSKALARLYRVHDRSPLGLRPRAAPPRARCARRPRPGPRPCSPGRLSTPEETSTCSAPVSRTASATFSGVEPAGQHPRPLPAPAADQPPVEGEPVAARHASASRGGRGVDQDLVGHPGIGVELRQVRLAGDPHAPSSPAARSARAPRRPARGSRGRAAGACRSAPPPSSASRASSVGSTVSATRITPSGTACDHPAGIGEGQVARRGRKEDEADIGRAGVDRRADLGARAQAADLDPHRPAQLPMSASTSSSGLPDCRRSRSTSPLSLAASRAFCDARRRCLCSRSHSSR